MKRVIGFLGLILLLGIGSVANVNMACMSQMAASGRAIGAEVDGPSGTGDYQTMLLAPSAVQLQPIWATASACLDRAYATRVTMPGKGGNVILWYTQKGSTVDWCGSVSPGVGQLGGQGAQRDYYSIWVACRSNQRGLPDVNQGIYW